jgi:hypothetical protein
VFVLPALRQIASTILLLRRRYYYSSREERGVSTYYFATKGKGELLMLKGKNSYPPAFLPLKGKNSYPGRVSFEG